ncbi:MAG: glycogen/starch/alpha-glucan family phosphorylase, partial [Clostridia bacterium]|nr:glycogen/starch/alpha-glucan family phosphorylase [Clostridia bacterium]
MNRAQKILKDAERILKSEHMVSLRQSTGAMIDSAIAKATLLSIADDWAKSQQKLEKGRRAAYISAEYLTGRAIGNNLYALGVLDDIKQLLSEKGLDPSVLEDEEDAALGNGGLGRLAACFLDSAATHDLPLSGYGLKYRYGLFKQKIENNSQVEVPDDWEMYSDNWTVRRDELSVLVELADGAVKAVPYDMPVIGYGTNNVGTLRLWQTESLKEFDFALFNDYKYAEACADKNKAEDIVKVLYPNDWNIEGKRLRLKQEYVLSSVSMQDILRSYEKTHRSYGKLAEYVAVQLNDTHPVLAIPELIRLLMKKGVSFTTACNYAKQVFAFTNHTVMPEALERWDMKLVASVNGDIAAILKRLHRKSLRECGIGLIRDGSVSMADTAVFMSFAVNGVAKIHSELVKTALFPEWYKLSPEKFHNKTNGVTQRRWLGLCNPELEQLLRKYAKADFIKDLSALDGIRPTQAMAEELRQVKQRKKQQLSDYLLKTQGVSIPSDFVFDIQIKRLHEYKRQLMNALGIYDLYLDIKAGKLKDLPPVAFIFGAKAAPGYARAKAVIRYINELANVINNDPDVNDRLRV